MSSNEIIKILITGDCTIRQAMETIDKGGRGIALVIDSEGRLKGTVTDGDIRRAILKGISLNDAVSSIMNSNFIFVQQNYSRALVETLFQKKYVNQIPVLDDDMRVTNVIFYHEFIQKPSNDNWAVIMAGGLGTRLYPLTRDVPKPMLRIGSKPIIETIIEQLKSYGYTNILLSLNYKADVITNYFQDGGSFGVNIRYITEKKRLGTAGALKLAANYLDKTFFVINGDILTKLNFEHFMNFHKDNRNIITIGTKKYESQIPYGVVEINDEKVIKIKEKPVSSFFISGGMYCLEPETISCIPQDEYFDMTQLIAKYLAQNKKIASFPITEYWMDIGRMDDYNQANTDYDELFGGEACAAQE